MSSAPPDKTDPSDPSGKSDEEQASDEALPVPDDEGTPDGLGRRAGLAVVQFYQSWISPALPPSCRFRPTCSEYTRIAIQKYGLMRGTWMGLKRLSKCHPFHPGGHDPVP